MCTFFIDKFLLSYYVINHTILINNIYISDQKVTEIVLVTISQKVESLQKKNSH
jgi:hypothetical protein